MNWNQLLAKGRLGRRPAKDESGRNAFLRDHDKIIHAFQRDQRLVGRDVAVAGILEHGGPLCRIALTVLTGQFPYCAP